MGNNFFRVPFSIFWEIIHGEKVEDPTKIVPRLAPEFLSREEVECTLAFDRLTKMASRGRKVGIAKEIVNIFDGFFCGLYKISQKVRELENIRSFHEN